MIYLRKMGAARVADLVEKDAEGLPIAFRIWQFGENLNAEGEPDLFDKESAALLLRQQEEIGREQPGGRMLACKLSVDRIVH